MIYDQGFGEFDFPRGQVNFSRYFLIRERADGSGRQTLTSAWRVGFSGADTPVFENFFAGGFTPMRGFRFRGPVRSKTTFRSVVAFNFSVVSNYMFPLTADDMIRAVTFVDYGTVEQNIEFDWKNFRAAPASDCESPFRRWGLLPWPSILPSRCSMPPTTNAKSLVSRWA